MGGIASRKVSVLDHVQFLHAIDLAASKGASLEVRFACMATAAAMAAGAAGSQRTQSVAHLCDRLRVPSVCRDLALLTTRGAEEIEALDTKSCGAIYEVLERCDAFRQSKRFTEMLDALSVLGSARSQPQALLPTLRALRCALKAAIDIDAKSVTSAALASGLTGTAIGEALKLARMEAIASFIASQREAD